MNIERVTYKIVKDALNNGEINEFIVKMMISYLTDEQRGAIIDEIVNEREHSHLNEGSLILFDPIGNKYDLRDLYEKDRMIDANLMDKHGYIHGIIIDDCNYTDGCSPYATEYKVNINYIDKDSKRQTKELRVKRSNILKLIPQMIIENEKVRDS